jgi:cytochrome c-type biogenesis protein CcmF
MAGQLVVFVLTFLAFVAVLIILNGRRIRLQKQEIFLSREFWIFTGGLIVALSAFQIILTTSIPVFNAITGGHIAPPNNPVAFYRTWQLPFALLIAGFIAISMILTYGENRMLLFLRKLIIPLAGAGALTVIFGLAGMIKDIPSFLLLFFLAFAGITACITLFFPIARPVNRPAVLSHTGFVVFIAGVLVTFTNSTTISTNTSGIDLGSTEANRESLLVMRGDTLFMGGFHVTYSDRVTRGNMTTYQVDFLTEKEGQYTREFSLYPSVNRNPRMGNVYNPDTRHELWRDYYTYIAAAEEEPDYIVIRTMLNPWINIMWTGIFIMAAGFVWALIRRVKVTMPQ